MEDPLETILLERLAEAQKYISFLEAHVAELSERPHVTVTVSERELQDYAHCPWFSQEACREKPCPDCNLIGASRV